MAKCCDFADYESVLESKWLTLLGFDPQVTACVTQPLQFDAIDARGAWQHTPDVFARRQHHLPAARTSARPGAVRYVCSGAARRL